MHWSIQDIARITGTTSRTLRHYDKIGLLKPDRIGANTYRQYGGTALTHPPNKPHTAPWFAAE